MALRLERCSANDSEICCARFSPMPSTSISRHGSFSITSSVRTPNSFTSSFAVAGPTPFTTPEAR